ncbi:type II/IV secretion system ATPase subunit [Halorubellus sp. JP-L1]|uniref:type II/IV secretion system ATPase subunit n=1 Tax=Halorubellus sp. JP-L1 TaxID=2715753 RepID=UPI00140B7680|nr:type II/IV secretion system ATPase subunit [Halorubellus sp. JP-L1]NHN40934.1 type II/IV secretion system ATPase subunit [Halorubellus sp. JP-L1]
MSEEENASDDSSMLERLGLNAVADWFGSSDSAADCACTVSIDGTTAHVDASDCDGDLATADACRRTAISGMTERSIERIFVESQGLQHRYAGDGVRVLSAAAEFHRLVENRDERLAELVQVDPLAVAERIETRVGPIAEIGRQSGLTRAADGIESLEAALDPGVGLSVGHYFVRQSIDDGARLEDMESLDTGSEARVYERPNSVPLYAVDVVDTSLSAKQRTLLLECYEAIANGKVTGERAASRALEYVTDESVEPRLAAVVSKHTQGYGILEDLFADPRVTDVYVTSPVGENPLRVVVDGQSMTTNVHLTPEGGGALASRIRKISGRAFSRAQPTVDATATLDRGTGVRVAGVKSPVAEGTAFAFREQAEDRFTLPELVANGTMPSEAAAFLSVAIQRNAAALIAGTRGAGKTTLLGTLLYELTPDTRTVVIEDTPELPVTQLQNVDRDVQALRTGTGDGPEITAADALRTALRLGDGALVVGEIRGEEAEVLYEAMRVGANANAVLGTIHGDGAEDVYERVVSDLGVEPSSFGATDLVVTVQAYRTPDGRKRRLSAIEEVIVDDDGIRFAPLYEIDGDQAVSTDRVDRGKSRFLNRLTGPAESYADLRADVAERAAELEDIAADRRTAPSEVAAAYATRGQ